MPSKFDPNRHHRRSIRLPGYDYSQPGAYFVTIVTHQRECLFGEVVNAEMRLNDIGKIVQWEWQRLAHRFAFIKLGTSIIMPNHTHGILNFHDLVGATRAGQTDSKSDNATLQSITPVGNNGSPLPRGLKPLSLGAIIGQFKSRVTKRLWKIPELNGTPIWQRNYYEHIIRNENEWNNIQVYIESNPLNWVTDKENPIHHAQ